MQNNTEVDWAKLWEEQMANCGWMKVIHEGFPSVKDYWDSFADVWNIGESSALHDKLLLDRKFLLDRCLSLVNENSTVLDIGAGMGIYSLPLAETASRVVSIEPSELIAGLRKNAEKKGLHNIEAIQSEWEKAEVNDFFDLIICPDVIYFIKKVHESVEKMLRVCRGKVLILITTYENMVRNNPFYAKLYSLIKGKDSGAADYFDTFLADYSIIYNLLRQMKKHPSISMHPSNHYFNGIEQAVSSFGLYFYPADVNDKKEEIKRFLEKNLAREDGLLVLKNAARYALIQVDVR